MLNFVIGLGVGVVGMFLIQRSLHSWYMGQINGLCTYATSLQQELWDVRYEKMAATKPYPCAPSEPH
jgi:hypothetical protein